MLRTHTVEVRLHPSYNRHTSRQVCFNHIKRSAFFVLELCSANYPSLQVPPTLSLALFITVSKQAGSTVLEALFVLWPIYEFRFLPSRLAYRQQPSLVFRRFPVQNLSATRDITADIFSACGKYRDRIPVLLPPRPLPSKSLTILHH
jgi:hypothetical protein